VLRIAGLADLTTEGVGVTTFLGLLGQMLEPQIIQLPRSHPRIDRIHSHDRAVAGLALGEVVEPDVARLVRDGGEVGEGESGMGHWFSVDDHRMKPFDEISIRIIF
jgi:hypothetical protein